MMNDFKTFDGVCSLFRSVNALGNQNCIFVAFKNPNAHIGVDAAAIGAFGMAGMLVSTTATGIADAITSDTINQLMGIKDYAAMIINVNEYGFGFIPLVDEKHSIVPKLDNCIPVMNNFVFVNKQYIESVSVKKLTIFNPRIKKIDIKIQGGIVFHLTANMQEKQIPYQKDAMNAFVSMYGK